MSRGKHFSNPSSWQKHLKLLKWSENQVCAIFKTLCIFLIYYCCIFVVSVLQIKINKTKTRQYKCLTLKVLYRKKKIKKYLIEIIDCKISSWSQNNLKSLFLENITNVFHKFLLFVILKNYIFVIYSWTSSWITFGSTSCTP